MFGRMLFAALLGCAATMSWTGDGRAASKTIAEPMFNGNRLAWCANWAIDCGKPAADAWCRINGFGEALRFSREARVGKLSPTRLIGTGAICDSEQCSAFRAITCETLPNIPPPAKIAKPAAKPSPAASPVARADRPAPGTAAAATKPEKAAAVVPPPKPDRPAAATEPQPAPAPKPAPAIREASAAPPAPSKQPDAPVTLVSAAKVSPTAAAAATRAFPEPLFKGRRLDWCRGWRDTCGKSTADEFCKLNGFTVAASFSPDPHIGARQPTRQIASGMVCDHELCDGFKEITCTN